MDFLINNFVFFFSNQGMLMQQILKILPQNEVTDSDDCKYLTIIKYYKDLIFLYLHLNYKSIKKECGRKPPVKWKI